MNRVEQICKALDFLEQYSFLKHISTIGSAISVSYYKPGCCITYHEYLQFGDCNVFLSNSLEDYSNHNYAKVYGLNWFVENVLQQLKYKNPKKRYSFLDMVQFYLIEEITKSNCIFNISLN